MPFFLFLALALGLAARAQPHYTLTPAAVDAYHTLAELRLREGRTQVAALRAADPDNLVAVWLADYADFFEAYVGVDEDRFEELEDAYDARLDELEERGPDDSPYHRYVRANMQLHWALARLKYGEYVTTFREARRAYRLLENNLERFPAFALARRELGVLQAAVATVPSGYQWGVELVTGMDGDLAAGRANLETALATLRAEGSPFVAETEAIYAFFLLNLAREPEAAWQLVGMVDEAGGDVAGFGESPSPLARFVAANVAMRTGRNDAAIGVLSMRLHSPEVLPFPYLDFMLGVCLQRRLDPSAAVYVRSFLEQRGERGEFVKEAYQKLAWEAALAGREDEYFAMLARATEVGTSVSGSDKNAMREARRARMPTVGLLRARLLFDGGYYARAAEAINAVDDAALTGEERIELPYRAARIAAARGRLAEAAALYKRTVSIGRESGAYFACKAAVELGALAEDAGRPEAARAYYDLALDLDPDEYGPGLHQQARSGLARLD